MHWHIAMLTKSGRQNHDLRASSSVFIGRAPLRRFRNMYFPAKFVKGVLCHELQTDGDCC